MQTVGLLNQLCVKHESLLFSEAGSTATAQADSLQCEHRCHAKDVDRVAHEARGQPQEALKLWHAHQEWRAQEKLNGPVRFLKVESWQDWETEFKRFLDAMPRKPYKFLAMVAAIERRRALQDAIQARKAKGRERFLRRYARHASPAQKIPRQAEHGTGGNDWAQGTREVRGGADSGGSYAEIG